MNRVFSVAEPILLPDGTLLSEIVGPATFSREKIVAASDVSVALGLIRGSSASEIHIHPIVSQVTFVVSGSLKIKMKGPSDAHPYLVQLKARQSVLTQAGTFFQLINDTDSDCEALYIVGPPFVFETDSAGNVLYNDALVLGKDWEALAQKKWDYLSSTDFEHLKNTRVESLKRLNRSIEAS